MMFKFDFLKRSPDHDRRKGRNEIKLGKWASLIENQSDFWYAFVDSKNQFLPVILKMNSGESFEKLKEYSKGIEYRHFKDYIAKSKQTLSDNLEYKDEYSALISDHDKLIDEIKKFNFHSIGELKIFFKQVDDVFKVTDLES